jgi:GTP-binding nuclear protein Ran
MITKNTKTPMKIILVVGDGGVGKTSYIRKQMGKQFISKYISTEGIQSYIDNDNNIIWYDFPGQEYYGLVRDIDSCPQQLLLKNSNIHKIIYMYDTSNKLSFKRLSSWKTFMNNYGCNIPYDIIRNKIDQPDSIKINNSDIKNTNKF